MWGLALFAFIPCTVVEFSSLPCDSELDLKVFSGGRQPFWNMEFWAWVIIAFVLLTVVQTIVCVVLQRVQAQSERSQPSPTKEDAAGTELAERRADGAGRGITSMLQDDVAATPYTPSTVTSRFAVLDSSDDEDDVAARRPRPVLPLAQ